MIYRLLLPFSLASVAPAAMTALPSLDVSITSDLTFASEYVFRGLELADRSFQPSVEIGVDDFYAGLWANLPIEQQDSELNYYGGYAFTPPQAPLALDAGITVYHFPDTNSNRTHEVFLGASMDNVAAPGLSAALYYFFDLDIHSHVVEGTLGYEMPLKAFAFPEASVITSIYAGGQGGSQIKSENYNYYGGSVELPYALTEVTVVTAGLHYATAEKLAFDPGKNLFWTISLASSF